jgi:predicted Holliday junction resolvase-like endonuclease
MDAAISLFILFCVALFLCIGVSVVVIRNERLKMLIEFDQWKQRETKKVTKSSDTSRNVIRGSISEQLAPLIAPDMRKYNLSDLKFFGQPVDYIVFDGMSDERDGETNTGNIQIVFLDVKTGNARLSPIQEKIKSAVEKGNIRWETVRIK